MKCGNTWLRCLSWIMIFACVATMIPVVQAAGTAASAWETVYDTYVDPIYADVEEEVTSGQVSTQLPAVKRRAKEHSLSKSWL